MYHEHVYLLAEPLPSSVMRLDCPIVARPAIPVAFLERNLHRKMSLFHNTILTSELDGPTAEPPSIHSLSRYRSLCSNELYAQIYFQGLSIGLLAITEVSSLAH